MSLRLKLVLGLLGIIGAAALGYLGTMQLGLNAIETPDAADDDDETDLAEMSPGERLCASQTTTDSIRQRIFARARTASSDDGALLTRLETGTVARMENPRLLDFDEGLEQARCEGRLVLELPRGTEPAFNYSRRLNASLEYIAQPAADGRGRIYRMNGADDLIDRLAEADLITQRSGPEFDDKPLDITIGDDKDEFEPEFDEGLPEDPELGDEDTPPPTDLIPPGLEEEAAAELEDSNPN